MALGVLVGCGGSSVTPPPKNVQASNTIVAGRVAGTPAELRFKGDNAILAQKWQEAVDAYEALLAGDAASNDDPQVIYSLAVAYEGIGQKDKARTRYREVSKRWPQDVNARSAVVREATLDGYLEDWTALGQLGESLLAKTDADPAEKMLGYGARGLSRILAKDESGATKDVNAGLDIVDETKYGMTGQLPVAAALLKFTLGEIRKAKSEKISLNPPGDDFVLKLEMRCVHLLEAQQAYADAIRSVDPYWAAMSGYRVGELYAQLHKELMQIPPTAQTKTDSDRKLFYAIMHVRYRVLLEKGVDMMERTLALGDRTGTAPAWMDRAKTAKADMEKSLGEEKEIISKLPYTEVEVNKALDIMKKHLQEKDAKKK